MTFVTVPHFSHKITSHHLVWFRPQQFLVQARQRHTQVLVWGNVEDNMPTFFLSPFPIKVTFNKSCCLKQRHLICIVRPMAGTIPCALKRYNNIFVFMLRYFLPQMTISNCQFTFCISSLCAACSLFIFPPYREAVRLCVCLVIIRGDNWTLRNLSWTFSFLKVPTSDFTHKSIKVSYATQAFKQGK